MVSTLYSVCPNNSAPISRTSDSATCATTSAWRSPKRPRASEMPRPPALSAVTGASAVALIAGASPNNRHAETATAVVNAKTVRFQLRSRNSEPIPAASCATKTSMSARATTSPRTRAHERQEHAFNQQLSDDALPRRADREANGDFTLSGSGAGQQQIRKIGAGDQQHEPGRAQQDE